MLKAFDNHLLQPLIFTPLCYGLRRSEVLWLKWKEIGFEENTLKIEHTVVKRLTIDHKGRTKSTSSKATYKLNSKVRKVLEQIKNRSKKIKTTLGLIIVA